jgi:5,10-methylenetetrahydromethanopterin reductase
MRSALVPHDHDDFAEFAARVETLGYDGIFASELWGSDAFVALARGAEATDSVALGTAIVNVYGRSPATLAQAGATLADAADRVRLGLGTSTAKSIEDLHGTTFENPPRRLHETVELTKAFLGGDGRVSYDGELFSVADFPALDADVPVYAAALGPAMRRATGRVADGWIPHNIPFHDLANAFETIAEAARQADRDPREIRVAPYVPSAVSEDRETALHTARGHVAYYVGSGEGYRAAVAAHYDAADAVAEAWDAGDRDGARGAVTDAMLEGLTVAGTPEEAREQLAEVAALDIVDEPIVVVPGGAGRAMTEQTVEALAPD